MPLSERTTILHHTLRSSLASIVVNDYPFPRFMFRTFSNSPFSNSTARFGKIHISAHENG